MTGNTINLRRYVRPIRWSAKPSSIHFKTIYIMKNLFLTTLFLALMLGQSFAQKTLAPSVEKYADNLNYTTKKMLNAIGYQLPKAEVESNVKQGVESRSNELQLDSTVTFYNYDPNGQADSLPLFKTVFTYPSANVERQMELVFENGTWTPLNRTTLTYDDLARIVETQAELFDPITAGWVPDSKVKVFPHGSSAELVDSVFVLGWSADDNAWLGLLSIWNSFDTQDRLTVSLTTIDIFGQPLLFKDVYTYNIADDNTLVESYLVDAGIEYFAGKRVLIYEEHHLVKEMAFAADGVGGLEKQYEIIYVHTPSWKLESQATFNWNVDSSAWWIVEAIFFEYDAEDRLASMETGHYTPDGDEDHQLVTYEYREGEYLAVETNYSYDFDLENFVLSDRKYYYYAGEVSGIPHEPVKVKSLVMFPNPTTGNAQLKLDANASVQVFDLSGKMVQGFSAMPGKATIDLVLLPAGIYEVKALAGKEIYTGKIVKQ